MATTPRGLTSEREKKGRGPATANEPTLHIASFTSQTQHNTSCQRQSCVSSPPPVARRQTRAYGSCICACRIASLVSSGNSNDPLVLWLALAS